MRTTLGILAALVALFAGGCGLVFFIGFLAEELGGRGPSYGFQFVALAVVTGVIPGIIAGFIAWWLLRKQPEPEDTDPNP